MLRPVESCSLCVLLAAGPIRTWNSLCGHRRSNASSLVFRARARDLADIPGGNTGLLVRDYKGPNADQPVYKADTALMAEMRATERQAAEEMGQWVERREKRRNGPN